MNRFFKKLFGFMGIFLVIFKMLIWLRKLIENFISPLINFHQSLGGIQSNFSFVKFFRGLKIFFYFKYFFFFLKRIFCFLK